MKTYANSWPPWVMPRVPLAIPSPAVSLSHRLHHLGQGGPAVAVEADQPPDVV